MRKSIIIGMIIAVISIIAITASYDGRKPEDEADELVEQIQELRQSFGRLQIDIMHASTPASYRVSQHIMIIDEQLTRAYGEITEYTSRLRKYQSIITVLLCLISALVVIKLIGYILFFHNVKVPRWLDVLL